MNLKALKADGLLLLTAIIWGAAFVAQRVGMDHVGPMTFNGVRFALGAVILLPLAMRSAGAAQTTFTPTKALLLSCLAGVALFMGAAFQQMGIVSTTAGKAGFITGLYVIFVPLIGLFFRQRPGLWAWFGATMAVVGLYLLSITSELTINTGDLLVLICAVFFAGHVLIVGWIAPHLNAARLACIQYATCATLSMIAAFIWETPNIPGIMDAAIPILYGGLMSVGVAYTLQVVAQKDAPPTHAAIILSLEGVFAAIAGWALLGEILTTRALIGCGLMLAGCLAAELGGGKKE